MSELIIRGSGDKTYWTCPDCDKVLLPSELEEANKDWRAKGFSFEASFVPCKGTGKHIPGIAVKYYSLNEEKITSVCEDMLEFILNLKGTDWVKGELEDAIQEGRRIAQEELRLRPLIGEVFSANPVSVDLALTDEKVMQYLVGCVIARTDGKADPKLLTKLVKEELARLAKKANQGGENND